MNKIIAAFSTVLATAVMGTAPVVAQQEDYPVDTVTVIVPYAAGGAGDLVGRIVADALSKRFSANFIVENIGGASGTIGAERAARAPDDGSTLLLAGNAIITTAPHLASVGFDPLADLTPVANVSEASRMLAATKTMPELSDFQAFIDYGQAHQGELNYGSVGVGSTGHIATVDMLDSVGVQANHIAYSGASEVVQAVLSGDIHFMLDAAAIAQVRQDAMTPLAVPGAERMAEFPDVPTLAELGHPSIRGVGIQMVMAPSGTSPEILVVLERALQDASNSDEFNQTLLRAGVSPRFMSGADLTIALEQEYDHYDQLLTSMGLK